MRTIKSKKIITIMKKKYSDFMSHYAFAILNFYLVQLLLVQEIHHFGPTDNDLDWSKSNGPSGFGPTNTLTRFLIHTINFKPFLGSGKKPKVKARAAELNAEPELFQFIANITSDKVQSSKISYPS